MLTMKPPSDVTYDVGGVPLRSRSPLRIGLRSSDGLGTGDGLDDGVGEGFALTDAVGATWLPHPATITTIATAGSIARCHALLSACIALGIASGPCTHTERAISGLLSQLPLWQAEF